MILIAPCTWHGDASVYQGLIDALMRSG